MAGCRKRIVNGIHPKSIWITGPPGGQRLAFETWDSSVDCLHAANQPRKGLTAP
jgi:hypothetical protein